jgi:hypothetical protein
VVRVAVQELWGAVAAPPEVMLIDESGVRIADRSATPETFVALTPLASGVYANALAQKRYGAEVTQIASTNLVALADALQRGTPAALSYRDANGRTLRAATLRTAIYPWTVVVFEPEDAILAPVGDGLWSVFGVTVIALLGGAVLSIAFRRVSRGN